MKANARVLISGVNWLGDACMTMPALQVFRDRHPRALITMLAKPALTDLWCLHPAVNSVRTLYPGTHGLWQTARALRRARYHVAYIMPNSWRSALAPWLAGIPERIGAGDGPRRVLLTRRAPPPDPSRRHQQWEYAAILELTDLGDALPAPALNVHPSESVIPAAPRRIPVIGLIPGAARGVAKQWPLGHFAEAARRVRARYGPCRFAVFGTAAEAPLGRHLEQALRPDCFSLAGQTTLGQLAASLARCSAVICNDSGGMHLSAAVGTPVVAIFGRTDPAITGPLGTDHQCLRASDGPGTRDIARHDAEAVRQLAAIAPEQVADAVLRRLMPAS